MSGIVRAVWGWVKQRFWLVPLAVGVVGFIIWLVGLIGILISIQLDRPCNWCQPVGDLGAATAGGAIVATAVLFFEQRVREQAENATLKFEVGIQKNVGASTYENGISRRFTGET